MVFKMSKNVSFEEKVFVSMFWVGILLQLDPHIFTNPDSTVNS